MKRMYARINRPRNKFPMPHDVETTFKPGLVVPLAWYPILPGDTFDCKMSYVLRMLTPINPVMDNAWLKVQAVFCPYEILFDKTRQFFGEADPGTWDSLDLSLPYHEVLVGQQYQVGSIADYLELPVEEFLNSGFKITTLPLRAYCATWNYWWRDENLVDKVLYPTDGGSSSDLTGSYDLWYTGEPLPAMKLPDYFTTCLPFTSKISPVELGGPAKVVPGDEFIKSGDSAANNDALARLATFRAAQPDNENVVSAEAYLGNNTGSDGSGVMFDSVPTYAFTPSNLWAQNASLTIETFRRALVYQHVGEILARGGSRYATEFLANIFGVENSESLLNEPEHLGSFERLINMTEVLSNADTDAGSSGRILGDNGAMSKTTGAGDYLFQHTFTRHGILMIVCTVRHQEHYFQGIPKKFTQLSFWDHYLPQAQGLGFQKVMASELKLPASGVSDQVFGYQDYGADYRYQPNRLAGFMRPNVTGALATWTYSQVFDSVPVLNEDFIKADQSGFDRVSAVDLTSAHQFFGNFHFDITATRVVGVQRFPGLNYV